MGGLPFVDVSDAKVTLATTQGSSQWVARSSLCLQGMMGRPLSAILDLVHFGKAIVGHLGCGAFWDCFLSHFWIEIRQFGLTLLSFNLNCF